VEVKRQIKNTIN